MAGDHPPLPINPLQGPRGGCGLPYMNFAWVSHSDQPGDGHDKAVKRRHPLYSTGLLFRGPNRFLTAITGRKYVTYRLESLNFYFYGQLDTMHSYLTRIRWRTVPRRGCMWLAGRRYLK